MNWIEVNNIGLRYEKKGHGDPTIVLIHEMGGCLETWNEVAPVLSKNNLVLRYDTRGSGMSEKIRGDLQLETLVEDLHALLTALDIGFPVVLVGCAVGAAVAIGFSITHPKLSAGLILMSPATGIDTRQRPQRMKRLEKIEHAGMRSIAEYTLLRSYPTILRDKDPNRFFEFKARWIANDPFSFAAVSRMLINMDLEKSIPKINCPTLVISGQYDEFRPPESCEKLAKSISSANYRMLPTGHHMPVQTPEIVTKAIADFLIHHVINKSEGAKGNN